jgi:hypothetical protein
VGGDTEDEAWEDEQHEADQELTDEMDWLSINNQSLEILLDDQVCLLLTSSHLVLKPLVFR